MLLKAGFYPAKIFKTIHLKNPETLQPKLCYSKVDSTYLEPISIFHLYQIENSYHKQHPCAYTWPKRWLWLARAQIFNEWISLYDNLPQDEPFYYAPLFCM